MSVSGRATSSKYREKVALLGSMSAKIGVLPRWNEVSAVQRRRVVLPVLPRPAANTILVLPARSTPWAMVGSGSVRGASPPKSTSLPRNGVTPGLKGADFGFSAFGAEQQLPYTSTLLPGNIYFQSRAVASLAPSASEPSLRKAISGSTRPTCPTKVAKPQSVPAITRSRPTTSANWQMR